MQKCLPRLFVLGFVALRPQRLTKDPQFPGRRFERQWDKGQKKRKRVGGGGGQVKAFLPLDVAVVSSFDLLHLRDTETDVTGAELLLCVSSPGSFSMCRLIE